MANNSISRLRSGQAPRLRSGQAPRLRSGQVSPPWEHLRLTDRIRPGVKLLFVGINPGVRSATTGHHFAGPSNRFWKLLWEARLTPEPFTHEDDVRLPELGMGVTNLVARPSPGIDVLKPAEYVEGWKILERKIDRYRPDVVALVGVTLWRAILPLVLDDPQAAAFAPEASLRELRRAKRARTLTVKCPGPQALTVHGAQMFVLPNPSGRNAHYSREQMLSAFRSLRRWIARP